MTETLSLPSVPTPRHVEWKDTPAIVIEVCPIKSITDQCLDQIEEHRKKVTSGLASPLEFHDMVFWTVCERLGIAGREPRTWVNGLTKRSTIMNMLDRIPLELCPHFLKMYINVTNEVLPV